MRRLIAVLVLVGGGWSQLSALDCPMAHASAQSLAAVDAAEGGGAHHHGAHGPEASDDSPPPGTHHSDSDCQLLMTCAGGVLVAGQASLGNDPGPITAFSAMPVNGSHDAVFPDHEPPPPRLPV